MHARRFVRHLLLAVILLPAVVAAQVAVASETPAKQDAMKGTAGKATVGVDRGQEAERIDAGGKVYAGRWQLASVEASLLGPPASQAASKSATLDVPASRRLEANPLPPGRAASSQRAEESRGHEPGFWAPVVSTLALAVFFFLRRLS